MRSSSRKILVIGSGAREHALARALARSPSVADVVVAPGNAGTVAAGSAGLAPIRRRSLMVTMGPQAAPNPGATSAPSGGLTVPAVVEAARDEQPGLVVVGPEAPLVAGLVDALSAEGILAFGPTQGAAILEGSKAFLKELAARRGIPTAPFVTVTRFEDAEAHIRAHGAPIVVKASGLCAGKGVVVATTEEEALDAARGMLVEDHFGEAGRTVVLEDALRGEEVSVLAVCDGERFFVLPPARDHKRVGDGDTGPNTGGMGAFAPSGRLSAELLRRVEREIIEPTLAGMKEDGRTFRGVLFAGLMITPEGDPLLLEHNVRFGDPECEAILELLEGDVAELLVSAAKGTLDASAVTVAPGRAALALVLAAHGYPAAPRTGDEIRGLAEAARVPGVAVLHAGTAEKDGRIVTAGGRVLALTASGATLTEARERAYAAAALVDFDGKHYRRDIALTGSV
jgi:phosphoribosylamine---glycine ligase